MATEYWVGVDPHVPTHTRTHHAVTSNAGEVAGWQTSTCAQPVALLLQRRGIGSGVPLVFDASVSTNCPACVAVVLGHEHAAPVSELRPHVS